ncbi:MAG TPA: dockerin type I domain-containing protein [Planctomycetota bacterium]|nr:dockerin type I domain-containing protein [Planctomycetota bacterium]
MRDAQNHEAEDSQLLAPKGLTDDLARLLRPGFTVPAEVDRVVLALGRRRIRASERTRRVVRWLAGAAVAAVLLVALWVGTSRARLPQDIDGSGRVDILDAFTLARVLDERRAVERKWDVTGDGKVDRADVDAVAMSAVRLDKGRVQ